jgi:hypothetical protein
MSKKSDLYEGVFDELTKRRNRFRQFIQNRAVKMIREGQQRDQIRDVLIDLVRVYAFKFMGGVDKLIEAQSHQILRDILSDVRLPDGTRAVYSFPVWRETVGPDGIPAVQLVHEVHHIDKIRADRALAKAYFDSLYNNTEGLLRNSPLSDSVKNAMLANERERLDEELDRWFGKAA